MIGQIIDWALALALAGLTGSLALLVCVLAQTGNWPVALVLGLANAACLGCLIMHVHDIVRPKRW